MRNRQKNKDWTYTVFTASGSTESATVYNYTVETMSDLKSAPGPLKVHKGDLVNGVQYFPDGKSALFYDLPMTTNFYGVLVDNRLNWKKLPTSNQFDILTTLAEFDDAIALFGKKFISSLSYGGYKWGWTPLLNDVSAVNNAANAVKNSILEGNRRSNPYNTTDKYIVKVQPFVVQTGYMLHQVAEISVKFSGYITYENDVCAFYDYMGFHPSPKLFWDLVPMSFAIDYVLPIGDALSNITPTKGWVKHANFTGWRVTTIKMLNIRKPIAGSALLTTSSDLVSNEKIVDRTYCRGTVLSEKTMQKNMDFKIPDFSQSLDIAYLAKSFVSGKPGRK